MILSCYSSRKDTNFIDIMFSLRTAGEDIESMY